MPAPPTQMLALAKVQNYFISRLWRTKLEKLVFDFSSIFLLIFFSLVLQFKWFVVFIVIVIILFSFVSLTYKTCANRRNGALQFYVLYRFWRRRHSMHKFLLPFFIFLSLSFFFCPVAKEQCLLNHHYLYRKGVPSKYKLDV